MINFAKIHLTRFAQKTIPHFKKFVKNDHPWFVSPLRTKPSQVIFPKTLKQFLSFTATSSHVRKALILKFSKVCLLDKRNCLVMSAK